MAIVKKYPAKVIDIVNPTKGVYTLEFESLSEPFKYYPGQFLHIAIDNEFDGTGQWPDSRCFSIQSNPETKTLKITYSVKGKFTLRMENEIQKGSKVYLKLPLGDFFLKEHNKENAIFISGGTGITPFLSLFNSPLFAKYSNPVLYAGFRDIEANFYQKELEIAKEINPQFHVSTIYQNNDGVINIEQIYSKGNLHSTYFISGPPIMIQLFRNFLISANVPTSQILTDDWE